MAAQVIALTAPSGLATPTVRVFADGSDAQVSGSPFALAEASNRKGYYTAAFTGTLNGLHSAHLYTGSNSLAVGWVEMNNANGTYTVEDSRALAAGVGGGGGGGATAEEIWAHGTRTLTAFGFTVGVTPGQSTLAATNFTRQKNTLFRREDKVLTVTTGLDTDGMDLTYSVAPTPGEEVLLELTTGDGIEYVNATTVRIAFTSEQTEDLPAGEYAFDLWRVDAGQKTVYAAGKLVVLEGVYQGETP